MMTSAAADSQSKIPHATWYPAGDVKRLYRLAGYPGVGALPDWWYTPKGHGPADGYSDAMAKAEANL